MNHYVQQAENFHDEMTILSMKASDDFLSQTRIRLPASSLYLPAKYVLLLQFFYGLKKPAGQKKMSYCVFWSEKEKNQLVFCFSTFTLKSVKANQRYWKRQFKNWYMLHFFSISETVFLISVYVEDIKWIIFHQTN